MSNIMQDSLEAIFKIPVKHFQSDILTDYFDEIEKKLDFKRWYCGHYHMDMDLGSRHTILYKAIIPLEEV